jgi:hypothetical protein
MIGVLKWRLGLEHMVFGLLSLAELSVLLILTSKRSGI